MPQVSVIVPVFNVEEYVGRCINSILSQTFRDLELILIDDGSTDGSLEICRNWEVLDSRVCVITQKNAGVSEARNRGLDAARGEYVQFVDADDYIDPDMTQKLLSAMHFYGREMAACSLLQIVEKADGSEERVRLGLHQEESERVFDRNALWRNMVSLVWNTSAMEGPCNKMYVRKIITDHALRFPSDISIGEDFLFNMEYCKYCNGLVFLAKPMYFYRVVEESGSLTCRARPDFLSSMCRVEKALRDSVTAHHPPDEEERQILTDHFMSRLCSGFLNLSVKCDEQTAKKQIAAAVQREDVQAAFAQSSGFFSQYAAFPPLVRQCDVGAIIAESRRIASPQKEQPASAPMPRPGAANRALAKVLRGLQRLPVPPLKRWAMRTEHTLSTSGLRAVLRGGRSTIQ